VDINLIFRGIPPLAGASGCYGKTHAEKATKAYLIEDLGRERKWNAENCPHG